MRSVHLALLAALFWGLYGFFTKQGMKHSHPLVFEAWYMAAMVAAAPVVWAMARASGAETRVDARGAAYVVAASASAAVAAILYLVALKRTNSSSVVSLTSGYPLITMLVSVALTGERVGWAQAAGAAMTAGGVWLLSRGL